MKKKTRCAIPKTKNINSGFRFKSLEIKRKNLYVDKKKIVTKNCELKDNKNFFILDGSVIPKGTFYPSFLIALNAYYYAKKIAGKN